MLLVPSGKFMMGSPDTKNERSQDEKLHEVELTMPFYLGKFPVTQEQYEKVLAATNPSYFCAIGGGKESVQSMDTRRFPVEQVSSGDAEAFCTALGAEFGIKAFRRFQLPTEAQWEYACRAGTRTRFHIGNELSSAQANFNNVLKRTSEVGAHAKFGNALGLFDMHGDVWEWCRDYYDAAFYNKTPAIDPECTNGSYRASRGGGWYRSAAYCRSADRDRDDPTRRIPYLGFRLALVPSQG
jgi:formylglycine-generating enzyme required for sulfatase activity